MLTPAVWWFATWTALCIGSIPPLSHVWVFARGTAREKPWPDLTGRENRSEQQRTDAPRGATGRPCQETILNYSKNGEPYWVEIAITPILNGVGQPHWLVAREHELPSPIPA